MEQNQFKCSGDCLKCHPNQRAYCASQFTYNTMRMVETMQETVNAMQGTVNDLKAKIEAIQDNEAHVFDPTKEGEMLKSPSETLKSPIAQSGDGAIQ